MILLLNAGESAKALVRQCLGAAPWSLQRTRRQPRLAHGSAHAPSAAPGVGHALLCPSLDGRGRRLVGRRTYAHGKSFLLKRSYGERNARRQEATASANAQWRLVPDHRVPERRGTYQAPYTRSLWAEPLPASALSCKAMVAIP